MRIIMLFGAVVLLGASILISGQAFTLAPPSGVITDSHQSLTQPNESDLDAVPNVLETST